MSHKYDPACYCPTCETRTEYLKSNAPDILSKAKRLIFEDLPDGSQAIRLNERGEPLTGIRYAKPVVLKVKKLDLHAKDLFRATEESSGLDIYALEDLILSASEVRLCSTGIAIEIPKGYEAQLRLRSGVSMRGIFMPNGVGTIDSDYRGEIKIPLLSVRQPTLRHITAGERVAQLVIQKIVLTDVEYTDTLRDTVRDDNGFGSTGQ